MPEENAESAGMNKYQLKKLISELEDIRGRNTELVSLYIPAGYDMSKISEFVTSESSEAENIKSKHTRKNVQSALDKIGRKVREEQETPENGVVFFAGNVSDTEGRPDIQIWEVHPPEPIESRRYRCDKEFVLEPLKQMIVDDRVYGLIVADKNEAAIGYLQGRSIKTAYTMESEVPGKTRAGGQCLDPETAIQLSDGRLKKLEDIELGDRVKAADFESLSLKSSIVEDKWIKEKQVFRIDTKFPRISLKASADHEVFTNMMERKTVEKLEEGEKLLFPESISTENQQINLPVENYYNSFSISQGGREKLRKSRKAENLSQKSLAKETDASQRAISKIELGERDIKKEFLKKICEELDLKYEKFVSEYCEPKEYNLPETIDRDLGEILGYFAGDGSFDPERLNFHEQDEDVMDYYRSKLEEIFSCNTSVRYREEKNYYNLRAFGKPLVEFIRGEFPEIEKSGNTRIPEKILRTGNEAVYGFLRGFYDAEGHCSESRGRIGISANNEIMMQQVQSSLLRAGVISSLTEYDNSENPYSNKTRFTVSISEQKSIEKFADKIGFTAERKIQELEKIRQLDKSRNNNRQIVESGERVREIIEENGLLMEDFRQANTFLQGRRQISKRAFKETFLKKTGGDLEKELKEIHRSELLPTQIKSIEKEGVKEVVDISVEAGNFIANNLVVHNSAQRFARLRKEMLKSFLTEIAEKAQNAFLDKSREDKLLGIIVGGPGFVKDKLLDDDYLHQELQEKVIARESLDTSGEAGLRQLVEKAEDAIEDSEAVREKQLMQEFFDNLKEENGKSEYGLEPVKKAMEMGAVETVLISEDFNYFRAVYECPNQHEEEVFEEEPEIEESIECPECGKEMELGEMQDIVDFMGEKAEEMGSELEIISTDHEEGQRLMNMGGIAAILRYRIR